MNIFTALPGIYAGHWTQLVSSSFLHSYTSNSSVPCSFPVDDIKRTLLTMSFVKMSMFHWHVVDSQSFPLVVDEFPELAETGAYAADKVYSPDDVQDVVQYANQVGALKRGS